MFDVVEVDACHTHDGAAGGNVIPHGNARSTQQSVPFAKELLHDSGHASLRLPQIAGAERPRDVLRPDDGLVLDRHAGVNAVGLGAFRQVRFDHGAASNVNQICAPGRNAYPVPQTPQIGVFSPDQGSGVALVSNLVRTEGVEPSRRCRLRILSPVCLPVPPRPLRPAGAFMRRFGRPAQCSHCPPPRRAGLQPASARRAGAR